MAKQSATRKKSRRKRDQEQEAEARKGREEEEETYEEEEPEAEVDEEPEAEAEEEPEAEADEEFDEEDEEEPEEEEEPEDEEEFEEDQGGLDEVPDDLKAEMQDLQAELGEEWIVRISVQGDDAWLTAETDDGRQRIEAPTASVLANAVDLLNEEGGREG